MALLRLTPVVPGPNVPAIELGAGGSTTVGRGQQAEVIVDDTSLSRLHARLSVVPVGLKKDDDLGSTNGVFVNGAGQMSSYLVVGDSV